MDKKKLVVCAVFENEARYLPEFLAYHRVVGVEHFVLYDNGSTDDPARVIGNSPLAEHVTLIPWPQRPAHAAAYRHFIDIFSPGFEWVAFLDVDEFLLPRNNGRVPDTLEWLSSAAAVLVHRRVFGPAAGQDPPRGLVIERHDRRVPDDDPANRHVRTLARCGDLLDVMENPREFRVSGQVFNTAGHLAPNSSVQAQPCYQNLVINHYAARSRQDWQAKRERNDATFAAASPTDQAAMFHALAAACQVHDTTIQAFAGAVREQLGLDPATQPRFDADPNLGMVSPLGPAAPIGPATPVVVAPGAGHASPIGVVAPATPAPPTIGAPPVPQSVVAAVQAALTPYAAAMDGARPEPRPVVAVSTHVEGAPAWVRRGHDAQERTGGLGMVFRDRSRVGEHWLAALRGAAVGAIDPAFLMDEYDRIRDFPTDNAARAACDAALAQGQKY